jgi:hypothetical protein
MGLKWSRPKLLGPQRLSMNSSEWWIDGSLGIDAAGNLYATWDTQGGGHDTGWLAYSTNHGRTWSPLIRVTPDRGNAVHILGVLGGARRIAYVGWLTDSVRCGARHVPCYAQFLRTYQIGKGWRTSRIVVSGTQFGNWRVWPGDTIGLSLYPGGTPGNQRLAVSWGSGLGGSHAVSQIWAAVVSSLP